MSNLAFKDSSTTFKGSSNTQIGLSLLMIMHLPNSISNLNFEYEIHMAHM